MIESVLNANDLNSNSIFPGTVSTPDVVGQYLITFTMLAPDRRSSKCS